MRILKKYKKWSNLVQFGSFFPLRILKFKKTKWKKIKKVLLKKKKSCFFIDHKSLVIQTKVWDRIRDSYKNQQIFLSFLKQRYDGRLIKQFCYSNEKKFFNTNYMKNEYQVDFLLYSLSFFSSVYEAQQYIKSGSLLINGVLSKSFNVILREGDILCVVNKKVSIPSLIRREFKFSFLEVDYYTQTVIVLKNLKNISFQDIIYNFNDKILKK